MAVAPCALAASKQRRMHLGFGGVRGCPSGRRSNPHERGQRRPVTARRVYRSRPYGLVCYIGTMYEGGCHGVHQ
eukprot:2396005-Prymnesium_polylepis.1